ncbi:hypothetical protein C6990_05400 [Nitrosopumilus sp. b3]|uniref:hypothetical protein n=1 Tax=Nitrosopumilus sp. b3 TaxID=2109909 RepID=UPI0015F41704|nr:hypothetical protein [Nitrosopumilus sp. b3]KAF6247117.1 hypothetical protein C6990_05400 [Nitrosopumilus sp. b3]
MYTDDAYVLAFADEYGTIHDMHITDELNSGGTWEYIDFKFTLPHSCYILIWRRDRKKIDRKNAQAIAKYVRDDLEDFIDEGKFNGSSWHQKIRQKIADNNNCLILAWDEMILPEDYDTWEEFVQDAYKIIKEKSEDIIKPGSRHDQELAIYKGKINFDNQDNPILAAYGTRTNKYTGYKIPSDDIIRKYVTEMLLENYDDANILLSEYYGIFPAKIDTEINGDMIVEYDFVNHKILLNLENIMDFELKIPALFLGFFKHLSCVNNWSFDSDPYKNILLEKTTAEKFSYEIIQRMLEIGIDPRKNS